MFDLLANGQLSAVKSLHVLGVVIFLGNIIVTAVWKALADRTGSPAIVGSCPRRVDATVSAGARIART
jgi:uncharacterized membrane protein